MIQEKKLGQSQVASINGRLFREKEFSKSFTAQVQNQKAVCFLWKVPVKIMLHLVIYAFLYELFWKTDPSLSQHDELGQETHITNEVHDYLAFKVFFVSVFLLGQDFTRFIRLKEPNMSYVMISYYMNMIYSLKSPFKAYFLMGLTLNVFVAVTKGDKIKRIKYNRLEMTMAF